MTLVSIDIFKQKNARVRVGVKNRDRVMDRIEIMVKNKAKLKHRVNSGPVIKGVPKIIA